MAKGTRRAHRGSWRQTAPLIPVALFASAFTVQATDDPAVAGAEVDQSPVSRRGDPIIVPEQQIDDPANVPIPGKVAIGVPDDASTSQVVSGLSRNGIPEAALRAYSRAQQVMSQADPSCNLPWTLVAAIGRVESNHGRHGGNVLTDHGVATPGVYGPRLDGGSTARITDTDGGEVDGDAAFDRAVGPMQFIPGTWRAAGVDGDGDGVRNPQDIDDAAMSAGVYLCSGDTNLADPGDLTRALLRYNHSQSYVNLVLSIANAYAGGSWIAVENGRREDDNQGIDRTGSDNRNSPDRDGEWNLTRPIVPPQPTETNRPTPSKPTSNRPTPTRPTPTEPTPAKPTQPTPTVPTPSKPPLQDPVATVQTAVGTITGTAGTTVAELTKATQYCQTQMSANKISPNQAQLQRCVDAYLAGGARAADQVIRDLLKLLGLTGILGG
jgi:Transglycosylase SLT domain